MFRVARWLNGRIKIILRLCLEKLAFLQDKGIAENAYHKAIFNKYLTLIQEDLKNIDALDESAYVEQHADSFESPSLLKRAYKLVQLFKEACKLPCDRYFANQSSLSDFNSDVQAGTPELSQAFCACIVTSIGKRNLLKRA